MKNVNEVNVELNKQIANLLTKGYIFSSILGNGHQGEEAKYILTNADEKKVAVVYTKTFNDYKDYKYLKGIKVISGHMDNFVESRDCSMTLWLDKFITDTEKTFTKVGTHNEIYTANEEFIEKANKVAYDRYEKRYSYRYNCNNKEYITHIPESIEKEVRATYGFKNTKGIKVSVHNTYYTVSALNNKGIWKGINTYDKKMEKHIHPKANEIKK